MQLFTVAPSFSPIIFFQGGIGMGLLQYWPVAIVMPKGEMPRLQYTYDSVHTLTKAEEVFLNWQNNYHYILLATWIEERTDSGERNNIINFRTYVDSWGRTVKLKCKTKKLVINDNAKEEPTNVYTKSH